MDQTVQDWPEFAIWYLTSGLIRSVFALCSVRTLKKFYSQSCSFLFYCCIVLGMSNQSRAPTALWHEAVKELKHPEMDRACGDTNLSLGCKALKVSWALGYLEPENHCLVQSSLAGKCFVCIVHKRKTRGHNYKQSLRHERLSGTALQIVEDGFQISLKNREVVCVQGRVDWAGLCGGVLMSIAPC